MLTRKYFIIPSKSCVNNSFFTNIRRASETCHMAFLSNFTFTQNQADLEDGFNALKHEDIEYSEDEKERKLGRKESEEPLAGVHVGFQSHRLEVLPQVRQVLLYQPVQLVEPHLQLLEILPVVKLFFRRPDMKTNIENTIEAALSVLTRFVSLRPT